jgi:hypothetical protein
LTWTCIRISLLTFLEKCRKRRNVMAVTGLILIWSREVTGWGMHPIFSFPNIVFKHPVELIYHLFHIYFRLKCNFI